MPSLSRTRCQHCGLLRRECAFAFPPMASFVAKAGPEDLRGAIVVLFATSDPAWPTLAAAFRTSVVGQRDPCVILIRRITRARATSGEAR